VFVAGNKCCWWKTWHTTPFLNELEELYGDPNQNMGCFMSAGGIGAATPPHFGPSSDHSGSKRDSRDNVINSLEKKKSCNVGELGLDIEPARLGSVQLELAH